MKRNILNIAFLAATLAAGAFVSCNENELDPDKGQHSGKKVSFSISEDKTRTAYDDKENLQINWVDGDKVRIFCDEAEDVKQADYTVVNIGGQDGTKKYTANLQAKEDGLAWGSDDEIHNFYAVYPADNNTIVSMDNGKVTINANLNQMCTVGAQDENKMYDTTPDMTNAIMVAKLSIQPRDEVPLSFKPIMTTLEVVVRGCQTNTTDIGGVNITGISINMDASSYGASNKQFIYDLKTNTLERGDINSTVQFFVGLKGNDGTNSLQLKDEESVKFTVFLPPVEVNETHPIKIRVHATGNTELTATIGGNALTDGTKYEIAQSSKRRIVLPWIKEKNGNNWITPLDNNIYVSQLSIPGTHDAGTGSGMDFSNSMTGWASGVGDVLNNIGVTQYLDIEQQWNIGIRAFDFRPAYNTIHNAMYLWHGLACTKLSMDEALDKIVSLLKNNAGEFAIIQMRKEDETRSILGVKTAKNNDIWTSEVLKSLNRIKNANEQYQGIVQWAPDLTIGDCRGKIIILTRNDYDNRELGGLVNSFPENRICGWFSDNDESGKEVIVDKSTITSTTNDNNEYIDQTKLTTISIGENSTAYYVQDYYKTGSDNGATKIALVKSMLKATASFCTMSDKKFYWALNHTSGYTGSLSRTSDYQNNAHNVNPAIYKYITSTAYTPGPMGIVFMDFVGSRDADNVVVYGDLLPQEIINNNYKYHMLRKGE